MPSVLFGNVFFAPDTFGGATIVVESLAKSFAAVFGWEVAACSVMSRPEFPPYAVVKMRANGITNYCINLPANRSGRDRYSGSDLAKAFEAVLDAVQPDMVNLHCMQEFGADALSAVKRRGLPLVLSIHDFWWLCERQFMVNRQRAFCGNTVIQPQQCVGCVENMSETRLRDDYLRHQLALADVITVPSEYARSIHVSSGLNRSNCIVLKNGIQLPHAEYWRERETKKQRRNKVVFAFVGGPGAVKGWPEIKQAVLALERPDAEFRVVAGPEGHDWWGAEQLNELPGKWSIVSRYSSDGLDSFFADVDVMLFPSRWKETFGLTVREALSRGVYVIASDAGGAAEDCVDGVDSTVLPFGFSVPQLAMAMQTIIDSGVPAFSPPKLHSEYRQALELKALFDHLITKENIR